MGKKEENQNKVQWVKRIRSALGIVAGVLIFMMSGWFWREQDQASFDQKLHEACLTINRQLPVMVDDDTRLDSMSSFPSRVLRYHYTLLASEEGELDPKALQNFLQPKIIQNIRTSPDMRLYKEEKVTFHYCYKDREGRLVLQLTIAPPMYEDDYF